MFVCKIKPSWSKYFIVLHVCLFELLFVNNTVGLLIFSRTHDIYLSHSYPFVLVTVKKSPVNF